MIKYFYITILFFFLFSCGGTTGHIVFYNFSKSKNEVEKELERIINKDSAYVVPEKWKPHTEDDSFERIYIYLYTAPEEMYQIGFTNKADWDESSTSRLGLVSVYSGSQFQYETDLSSKEKVRIQKRFEKEVLSKIKYSYSKSN